MNKTIVWALMPLMQVASVATAQEASPQLSIDHAPISGCRKLSVQDTGTREGKSVELGCISDGTWELRIGDAGSGTPDFGGQIRSVAKAGDNSIVASAINDLPANSVAFQTAVTGYCRSNNPGNACFGLFGRADLYSSGVVTNEVNSFNWAGTPTAALPPDRSLGGSSRLPVALTVAAGGAYDSSIAIQLVKEGEKPQSFLTGLYINPDAIKNFGIFIDSTATSNMSPLVIKHSGSKIGIQLMGVGEPAFRNAAMTYRDGSGTTRYVLRQSGDVAVRAVTSNGISAPRISSCTGTGVGGGCTLGAGSGDGVGTIILKGGRSAPAKGGTVELTFSLALGEHSSACVLTPGPGFAPNTALFITAQSSSAVMIGYIDGGPNSVSLSSGTSYAINYHCMGR